jgi:hypothetical protein
LDQDRDFTREPIGRFEWEQVMRRVVVSKPSVKLVALTMATYASTRTGGQVRPGVSRLVAVTGTSRNVVLRALAELKELGMIDQLTRGGNLGRASKGMASIYQLTLPSDLLEGVALLTPEEQEQVPASGHDSLEEVPLVGPDDPEEVPQSQEQVPIGGGTGPRIAGTGPNAGTLPLQTHLSNKTPLQTHPQIVAEADPQAREPKQGEIAIDLPAEEPPLSKAALTKQLGEDFNDWYAIYPKHVGRGAAVNSYTKARKNGATVEELTAGARRYAAERKGQDPQFTKAPANWLNQECWTDEPDHTGEIDVDAILGKDYWTAGTFPEGLDVAAEIAWKKEQRVAHNAERLAQAKAKTAAAKLSPWDPAYHQSGRPTTSQKMQRTLDAGRRLQAQYDAANGVTVPRQYQWCNPPRELEAPTEESA